MKVYLIAILLLVVSTVNAEDCNQFQNGPVKMFKNWIYGVKNSDFKKFKDGYLEADWENMTAEEKNKLLSTYKVSFEEELGDFEVEEFEVGYKGNDNKGKVIIKFQGNDLPSLSVKNINGDWVLAER